MSSESITFPFSLFHPFIRPLVKQKQQLAYDTTVHSVRAVAGVEQRSDDCRGQNPHDTRDKIISVDCLTLKTLPAAKFRKLAMPRH